MRRMIGRFSVVLCAFAAFSLPIDESAAQLPPEIMADRYLMQAELLLSEDDFEGAFEIMGRIIALQREHDLKLPDEFHFKYAKVALSADSVRIAIDSIGKYLSATGKQGEFYKEALALSIEAERPRIRPEETCAGKPDGASCWKALSNHADCYFWITDLKRRYTAAWSGKCSGRFAMGQGTITWSRARGDSVRITGSEAGRLRIGRRHGKWVAFRHDGSVWNRTQYVDGKEHGQAEYLRRDGSVHRRRDFVDGKLNGQDVNFRENGSIWNRTPYVDGKMHGQSESFREDGSVFSRSSYVDGKEHGPTAFFNEYGSRIGGGQHVNGEKHGHWIEPGYGSELNEEGTYVHGKKHGDWVTRYANRYRSIFAYSNGEPIGVGYEWRDYSGKCWRFRFLNGVQDGKGKKVNKKFCRE